MNAALSGKLDIRWWLSFRKSVNTISTVARDLRTLVVAVTPRATWWHSMHKVAQICFANDRPQVACFDPDEIFDRHKPIPRQRAFHHCVVMPKLCECCSRGAAELGPCISSDQWQ